MGKKRHSQDKLWITYKELVEDWGGKRADQPKGSGIKKLPFYCCSLSFMPFKDPVCIKDGTIFDLVNILPYIKKYHKNPVTGKPIKTTDLIKLNFHKNEEGEYACPITYKTFTDNSYIIAIPETGNVYSYEAYEELNKKPKKFNDLLNNSVFDPENIIVIQDPNKNRIISEFHFIKNKDDVDFIRYGDEMTKDEFNKNIENFVNIPARYSNVIEELKEGNPEYKRRLEIIQMINNNQSITVEDERLKTIKKEHKKFIDTVSIIEKEIQDCELTDNKKFKQIFMIPTNVFVYHLKQQAESDHIEFNNSNINTKTTHSKFTDGKVSTSFTSTAFDPVLKNKLRKLTDDELRAKYYSIVKSRQAKGYVKLLTNYGPLNLLIHCDLVPKTAENFLELCQTGYYDNTIFHRLVKNFCLQGGDPTGTGTGGSSIFGKPIEDEFHQKLLHKGRGVLSMANTGKHTNQSQFFITLKATPHLDEVHTVFGEVVGNVKLLDDLEAIGSDQNDKPKKEIKILSAEVYSNPFREVISEFLLKEFSEKIMKEKLNQDIKIELLVSNEIINNKFGADGKKNQNKVISRSSEIGKYLGKKRNLNEIKNLSSDDPYLFEKPKQRKIGDFDFSKW